MIEPDDVEEGRVRLSVDGQKLTGTLLTPEAPVPGFLFVHGWGGDQEEDLGLAEDLARLGCICFTFDLRGHAESDASRDEVTRQNGLDDVTAAYDYLASQPLIDPGAIGVIGTSYGGYLSALLTSIRDVRWLAVRPPLSFLSGLCGRDVPAVPANGLPVFLSGLCGRDGRGIILPRRA